MAFGWNKGNSGGAGHVKQSTRGTSNEISFSVLDNMASPEDEADKRSPLGRISLFTLGRKRPSSTPSKDPSLPEKFTQTAHAAPNQPAWEISKTEVTQRRAQRRRQRRYVIVGMTSAAAIVIAVGGFFLVGYIQNLQERALNLTERIDLAYGQFEEASSGSPKDAASRASESAAMVSA